MGKRNGSKPRHKIGKVLLGKFESEQWEMRYIDPADKKYRRVRLPYTGFADAKAEAEARNIELAARNGHAEGMRRRQAEARHTVRDAVLEAVRASDANGQTQKQYVRLYNTFSTYLEERAPDVNLWCDVDEKAVADYHAHSRGQGVSWDTIRQRLAVLKLTARYMTRTYPGQYRIVTDAVRLKRKDPPKAELEAGDAVLSPAQIRSLLAWLKEHDPMVHAWACMGALAGMRMREYCYLRERDVDLGRKTITVAETEAHKPKTRSSYRTIPVCGAAVDSLRRWMDGLERKHPLGFLFFPERQAWQSAKACNPETRAGCYSGDAFSRRFLRAVAGARAGVVVQAGAGDGGQTGAGGVDLPPRFIPRKLRASFVTAMRGAGADYADLQTYLGHSVGTTMSVHYDRPSLERLARIAALAQALVVAEK
jgi:integrase